MGFVFFLCCFPQGSFCHWTSGFYFPLSRSLPRFRSLSAWACLTLCHFYISISVLFLLSFCASLPLTASSVCPSLHACLFVFVSVCSISTYHCFYLFDLSVSSFLPLFCPVHFCPSGHPALIPRTYLCSGMSSWPEQEVLYQAGSQQETQFTLS